MSQEYINRVRAAAARYFHRGWRVVPVGYRQKGKLGTGWRTLQFETEDELLKQFEAARNVGVALGRVSDNVVDVDIDSPAVVGIADVYLPETATFGRPSHPRSHRIYRMSDFTFNTIRFQDPITREMYIELRGDGGQTIFPPSHHKDTGEEISWSNDAKIADITKDELVDIAGCISAAAALASTWPTDARHWTTLALAGWLVRNDWSVEEIERFVSAIAIAADDDELESDRIPAVRATIERYNDGDDVTGYPTLTEYIDERILKAVRKWLKIQKTTINIEELAITDQGNVQRLVARYGDRLRYCQELGGWFIWNGKAWAHDPQGLVAMRYVGLMARDIYSEAARGATAEERQRLADWARLSEMTPRIEAVTRLARSHDQLNVKAETFDSDPFLLNVQNGTIDLRTGDLNSHNQDDMITMICETSYEPLSECPMFMWLVRTAFDGDEDLISFYQRGIGATLIGRVDKHMFVSYGDTNTGKTTIMTKCFHRILRDYAVVIVPDAVGVRRMKEQTMWMAELKGKRYAVLNEPPRGFTLDVSMIKNMTGGNIQKGRKLYGMPFEFEPTATFWVDTNWKPGIPDPDDSIWQRVKPIHFKRRVMRNPNEPEYVENVDDRLKDEFPGILRWAIEGCLEYQLRGLDEPDSVKRDIQEYRHEEDEIGEFLMECAIQGDDYVENKQNVWNAYTTWCSENNYDRMKRSDFSSSLERLGFESKLSRVDGVPGRRWHGFMLNPTSPYVQTEDEGDEVTLTKWQN